MNKKVTEHISYNEVIYSETAKRHFLPNEPNERQLAIIKTMLISVFEPLREWTNEPIKVNSIFRSRRVNSLVNGSKTSAHMVMNNTCAIDIDDVYGTKSNYEMGMWIMKNLKYDKLIFEDVNFIGQPSWIHISYNTIPELNKQKTYIMKQKKGKYIYLPYDPKLLNIYP